MLTILFLVSNLLAQTYLIYVDPNKGRDDPGCGPELNPCATIFYPFTVYENITFFCGAGNYYWPYPNNTLILADGRTTVLDGERSDTVIIPNETIANVPNGKFTISMFTIQIDDRTNNRTFFVYESPDTFVYMIALNIVYTASNAFANPFVYASRSIVIIDSCNFSNYVLKTPFIIAEEMQEFRFMSNNQENFTFVDDYPRMWGGVINTSMTYDSRDKDPGLQHINNTFVNITNYNGPAVTLFEILPSVNYTFNATTHFLQSSFINCVNLAKTGMLRSGGAYHFIGHGGNLLINMSSQDFTNCSAPNGNGGAICLCNVSLLIYSLGNILYCSSGGSGGGICAMGVPDLNLTSTINTLSVINCSSVICGGGVCVEGYINTSFQGTIIRSTSTAGHGGAGCIHFEAGGELNIDSVSIAQTQAGQCGGAFCVEGHQDGSPIIAPISLILILNSIFSNCTAFGDNGTNMTGGGALCFEQLAQTEIRIVGNNFLSDVVKGSSFGTALLFHIAHPLLVQDCLFDNLSSETGLGNVIYDDFGFTSSFDYTNATLVNLCTTQTKTPYLSISGHDPIDDGQKYNYLFLTGCKKDQEEEKEE